MREYKNSVEISADTWAEVLVDRTVTEKRDLIVLRLVYESANHEMHASEIAPHLNYTGHAPVNARIARFSKRVVGKTGVRPPMNDDGAPRWWNVPFWGCDKDNGMCSWIMRPELVEACEQVFGQNGSELVYPGEVNIEESTVLSEGAVSKIFVNHHERDKQARTRCIEHYGCRLPFAVLILRGYTGR